jgi:lysophospholipase L1-like esterase
MARATSRFGRWLHTGWDMIGITALIFITVELLSLGLLSLLDTDPRQHDFRLDCDAYAGAPWAAGYFEEDAKLRARWNSYTYWRMAPFDGRYIHIDDEGRRRTIQPVDHDGPTVFMFGGSTMWGTGSRDDYTIPSQLASALARDGYAANIVNFGEIGYVSTQEVLALMLELRRGNIPDVVVFYDGINDVTSAIHSGRAGIPHNEYRRRAEFNLLSQCRAGDYKSEFFSRCVNNLATVRIVRALLYRMESGARESKAERVARDADTALTDGVADAYVHNIEIVRMLAERYGFTAHFYLQPVIFEKDTLTAYEQTQLEAARKYRDFFTDCYAAIAQKTEGLSCFHDISGVLANCPQPCFLDFMHIDEKSNGIVAEAIAGDLEMALR